MQDAFQVRAATVGKLIADKADHILARHDSSARGSGEQRRHASALLHLATRVSGDTSYAARAVDGADQILEKDRELAGEIVYRQAELAYGDHDLPAAVMLFDIALSIQPDDDWQILKGFAQLRLQDFTGAKASFEAVRGYHAKNCAVRVRLCDLRLQGIDLESLPTPRDPEEARVLQNFLYHMCGAEHSPESKARRERLEREQIERWQAQAAQPRADVPLAAAAPGVNPGIGTDLDLAASTALQFAEHLVRGDFAAADAMLTGEAQPAGGAEDLRTSYLRMTMHEDDGNVPGGIEVMVMETLARDDPDELGWVYVAISGDEFNEAVRVVVTRVDGQPRISKLTWGRP